MSDVDVLIVGAGPTGLALALWLSAQGVGLRIVDKTPAPAKASRALALQARTLELYRQLGLTDEILNAGHRVPGINMWVKGRKAARISFERIAEGLTPYGPFIYPQDQHERLLLAHLEKRGIVVERSAELVGLTQEDESVVATLRRPDGQEERVEAKYLAGCDSARSFVRQAMRAGYPGGDYEDLFYVADVEGNGAAFDGELHIDLDEADFLAVFPMKGDGRGRLIGTVKDERAHEADKLRFEDVSGRAISNMKIEVKAVNWFSTYRVHHRVTDKLRDRRVFLLGDAAHIHSPAGGQGMNTGIGDAINLAWKLKAVLDGRAPDALLDTYEAERRAFALRLVATTDRAFSLATARGRLADFLRTQVFPVVFPALFKLQSFRRYVFRAVAQISLAYPDSALSAGKAGDVKGGDRLPWISGPGVDNLDALKAIGWQVHVYGEAAPRLRKWCEENQTPLFVFPWCEACAEAGLAKDATYLLRPDAYVGLAAATQDPASLDRYFAEREIAVGKTVGSESSV